MEVLRRLLITEQHDFDGIIIETTGLADPAPIAQTFFVEPDISERCSLDAIITVVDAKHVMQHLDEVRPEGVENETLEQIAFADKLLISKCDLVDKDHIEKVTSRIRSINSTAEIVQVTNGEIDPSQLLNIQGFNLQRILEKEPDFLDVDAEHQHDDSVTSVSMVTRDPLIGGKILLWIEKLVQARQKDLLRFKGVVNVAGMQQRYVFQGVHMIFAGEFTTNWKPTEERMSRFVFIGRNLNKAELEAGFVACRASELRFPIGRWVECKSKQGWVKGTVVNLWENGDPYTVKLINGAQVCVQTDDDTIIRGYQPPKNK